MPSGRAITRQQAVIMATATIIAMVAVVYLAFRPGPALAPREFELSGLVIEPNEVEEGDSVVISVDIRNVGETEFTESINLKLNDTIEDSKEITLEGEKTTTVTFNITKEAGNYSVAINELTGTLTIRRREWDLVIFGGSQAWGIGKYYAAYMEEDLGVKVTVHDETAGSETAHDLLKKIRELNRLRELVSEAEVVTFQGSPTQSISETNPFDYDCVFAWEYYVVNCSIETFDKYIADLKAIIEEILLLRDGSSTILRVMDYYCPLYGEFKEQGIYEECRQCWENSNIAVHLAAAAHNVPVACLYDAFNGPNHDEDPFEKGYLLIDGHANEEGQKVIANIFRELGYEPVNP